MADSAREATSLRAAFCVDASCLVWCVRPAPALSHAKSCDRLAFRRSAVLAQTALSAIERIEPTRVSPQDVGAAPIAGGLRKRPCRYLDCSLGAATSTSHSLHYFSRRD